MITRFWSSKTGGSSKAIDYLLNEREQLGTARTLKGDPNITREIINSSKFKQKVTVGCLAFEEKNLSENQKYKIMEDFEKHLLPGMEDRYNILWVEHTDKENLELNFVIPKIDLETQKALNPYYHKADKKRIHLFQEVTNLEYNLTSPDDPSKKRTLEVDLKKGELFKDYEQLDKLLHNLVQDKNINNRSQLIETLENNNITITRKNKDGLSIKLPDSKRAKRFKGGIYSEQFRSIAELREISKGARTEAKQYNQRDTKRELEKLRGELNKFTQDKSIKLIKSYGITKINNRDIEYNIDDNIDDNNLSSNEKPTTEREHDHPRGDNLHRTRPKQNNKKQQILSIKGLEEDDRFRAELIRGSSRHKELLQRTIYNARETIRESEDTKNQSTREDIKIRGLSISKSGFTETIEKIREFTNKAIERTRSIFKKQKQPNRSR